MRKLIQNATVVFPNEVLKTDVLVEGSKIADVNPAVQLTVDEHIDATGLHLLPGIIDDQVHFREPGLTHKEDLYTGSKACAKGGITTFLEMPNTNPTTTTCDRLHEKLEVASQKCLVNYGFYIGATCDNVDELKRATRTPGIKIFIGSSTGNLLVDEQDALERIFAETTLPITAHCEDESTIRANAERIGPTNDISDHSRIRDHAAAVVATKRAIDLAVRHNHHFHVLHVSTADEVPIIAEHPELITAEVCPHHLFFNVEDYARLGSRVQMNPSIKTKRDNEALWQALLNGTIGVVATDHAPHTLEEKEKPYPQSPSGLPAVELSLALMLNEVNRGRCSISQVAQWMSAAPAQVWSLSKKGKIEVGADADLVLVDLDAEMVVLDEDQVTKSGWTPWHGETLRGKAVATWVMGHEVYRDGGFDESVRGQEVRYER